MKQSNHIPLKKIILAAILTTSIFATAQDVKISETRAKSIIHVAYIKSEECVVALDSLGDESQEFHDCAKALAPLVEDVTQVAQQMIVDETLIPESSAAWEEFVYYDQNIDTLTYALEKYTERMKAKKSE